MPSTRKSSGRSQTRTNSGSSATSSRKRPKDSRAEAKARSVPKHENLPSAAGFHFLDLYNNCQWKFFLRFVLGFEPRGSPAPLVFGGAFHAAKAVFYQTEGDTDEAISAIREYFDQPGVELEDESQRETLITRARTLLTTWITKLGRADFSKYRIIGVEKYCEVPVPGLEKFVFTGRIDLLVRDRKDDRVYIIDTKTSGYSLTLTSDSVLYGDQATAYYWLAQEATGMRPNGFIPDISYWSRSSTDASKIVCSRPIVVYRKEDDIEAFKLGVMQAYAEVSQKLEALSDHDPRALFRRNTHYCVAYGHVCEFADHCRSNRLLEGRETMLFRLGKRKKIADLGRHVVDRMAT